MENIRETEIRKNLLTGDWSIVAPSRALRMRLVKPECPFCNLNDQEKPVLIYNNGKIVTSPDKWTTLVIPNKFPVFDLGIHPSKSISGDYEYIKSKGYHDLVITDDHDKDIPELPIKHTKELLSAYQDRILTYKKEDFVNYIFVFKNHGTNAGASQKHPHSQIITLPFIDRELEAIINESKNYHRKNNKCLHCKIIEDEISEGKRILFENESFIAYIPFAPKFIFQVIVAPKEHESHFEDISEKEKEDLAEAFKYITKRYKKKLNDPSYNYYLHNSPCDKKNYDYFHWYFAFMPRLGYLAGFEISANMEIISQYPEDQVKFLKK
ncbi:MAG: galactose-1-phosphate uridylyltransferase [Candidatus Pacebacteria bacterium]|nr:galactose-1-phosphate uridylyltransferase [Candidatus Paceibacterota bacterium]